MTDPVKAMAPVFARMGGPTVAVCFGRVPNVSKIHLFHTAESSEIERLYAGVEKAEAKGVNSYINWGNWESVGDTLDKDSAVPHAEQRVLWVDMDNETTNPKVYADLTDDDDCFVQNTPSGYPHQHLVFILDEPISMDEVETLNHGLKQMLGGDHKHSRVAWLRVPLSRSFSPKHSDNARMEIVK